MQIDSIDASAPSPHRGVDSFSHQRLSDVGTLDEVLAHLRALREADPGMRFLCTLDDPEQCIYTSMHAGEDERIWLDGDPDFDDPASVRAYEQRRLAHVAARLQAPAHRLDWERVAGALAFASEEVEALVAANTDPAAVLDAAIWVQRLPVARDDLLIAGLPNGYFRADLDLFQNHAIIRHLQAAHGYRFFGLGASWLGFVRDAPPAADAATRLVTDLRGLYDASEHEDAPWSRLQAVLGERTTLLLGYTENFAETLDG